MPPCVGSNPAAPNKFSIAQLVEQRTVNPLVVGSNPAREACMKFYITYVRLYLNKPSRTRTDLLRLSSAHSNHLSYRPFYKKSKTTSFIFSFLLPELYQQTGGQKNVVHLAVQLVRLC